MESKKGRVLAYSLAKTIEHDALAEVSGGANAQMSSKPTVHVTGSYGLNVDTAGDVTVDW